MHETFWDLIRDAAHWEFELFLMLVVDGLIVGVGWRFVCMHWRKSRGCEHDRRDPMQAGDVFRNPGTRPYDWNYIGTVQHVRDYESADPEAAE